MSREGVTIRRIRELVRLGKLVEPFTVADVNTALGIHWAGTFLPKHRVGNPGHNTALFIQVGPGRYRLR
jgi:hypothetical protein